MATPAGDRGPTLSEIFTELKQFYLDTRASLLMPADFCLEHRVVVVGAVPDSPKDALRVGIVALDDYALRAEVERRLGRPAVFVQLNDYEIRQAIARIYQIELDMGPEPRIEMPVLDEGEEIRFIHDAPISVLANQILLAAIRRKATDVHIEVYPGDVDLRFRLDGLMTQVTSPLSPENVGRVISRLKVLANLDIGEKRKPQDGRFLLEIVGPGSPRRVDVRLSVVPGVVGEEAALRIFDRGRGGCTLPDLGMPPAILERYRRLARSPGGMLLATGPTASGKTTTLYATIREREGGDVKIMTIEDPVEYEFSKVSQKEVTPSMGFADALRAFLRQNADVLYVGEIRDAETAEVAVRAATTGHLILSTLHTRDAVSTVDRLRGLGIPNDLLAGTLLGILAQRLVRRVCEKCREPYVPDGGLIAAYDAGAVIRHVRGRGCEACGGTGCHGMTGIFELFVPDERMLSMISEGAPAHALRAAAAADGYRPMVADALDKVAAGTTNLDEIARRLQPRAL